MRCRKISGSAVPVSTVRSGSFCVGKRVENASPEHRTDPSRDFSEYALTETMPSHPRLTIDAVEVTFLYVIEMSCRQFVVSIGKFNQLKATQLHHEIESPLARSLHIYLFKPRNTEDSNPVTPNHHFL
jgi:hypothetical protein